MKNRRPLWIALLTVALILTVWTSLGGQGLTNAVTRAVVRGANWLITGEFDFISGTLRLQRGTGNPAAGDCDANDGTDTGVLYVKTDTAAGGDDAHAWLCLDDTTAVGGWQEVLVQQVGAVAETTGNFEATGRTIEARKFYVEEPGAWKVFELRDTGGTDVTLLRSQTLSSGVLDIVHEESGDLVYKFNSASDETYEFSNIGAGVANVTVPGGGKVGLEGVSGDTYHIRDTNTTSLDSYHDGTLATQTRTDHWIPPACPVDLNDVSFGGMCMDVGTGKIRYRGILEAIP